MKTFVLLLGMATTADTSDPSTFNRFAGSGNAQKPGSSTQFYDRQGISQGRATTTTPGNRRYFDRQGKYDGRATQNGSATSLYDRQGVSQGRIATTTPGNQTFYNRQGVNEG